MSEPTRVLLVEDEPSFRELLSSSLMCHGFHPIAVPTAAEAILSAKTNPPELILLDLGLPDADGLELAKRLRRWCQAPIVVISARHGEDDKIRAFDAGADDYMTKPFGLKELIARARLALRHAAGRGDTGSVLEFGHLCIDVTRRVVMAGGKEVHLTPIEYKCLLLLARNAGKVLTHSRILEEVWGPSHASQTHYVRVRMVELRRKLEKDPSQPSILLTEPGIGYRLRA